MLGEKAEGLRHRCGEVGGGPGLDHRGLPCRLRGLDLEDRARAGLEADGKAIRFEDFLIPEQRVTSNMAPIYFSCVSYCLPYWIVNITVSAPLLKLFLLLHATSLSRPLSNTRISHQSLSRSLLARWQLFSLLYMVLLVLWWHFPNSTL